MKILVAVACIGSGIVTLLAGLDDGYWQWFLATGFWLIAGGVWIYNRWQYGP